MRTNQRINKAVQTNRVMGPLMSDAVPGYLPPIQDGGALLPGQSRSDMPPGPDLPEYTPSVVETARGGQKDGSTEMAIPTQKAEIKQVDVARVGGVCGGLAMDRSRETLTVSDTPLDAGDPFTPPDRGVVIEEPRLRGESPSPFQEDRGHSDPGKALRIDRSRRI